MKKYIKNTTAKIIGFVCLTAMVVSSCKKDEDPIIYGDAKVRVVNTVPGSASQDFYQGDTKLTSAPVAYGSSSSTYLSIKAGNSSISFRNAANSIVAASDNLGVDTDVSFTAFYYANTAGTGLIAKILDDNILPTTGKAKVRFINFGSTFLNSVAVKTANDIVVSNPIGYGNVSAYATVDANVDLQAYVVNSSTLTTIPGTVFQANKIYTIWLDAASSTTVQYHVIQQN